MPRLKGLSSEFQKSYLCFSSHPFDAAEPIPPRLRISSDRLFRPEVLQTFQWIARSNPLPFVVFANRKRLGRQFRCCRRTALGAVHRVSLKRARVNSLPTEMITRRRTRSARRLFDGICSSESVIYLGIRVFGRTGTDAFSASH